jgi:hypothetical protein
MKEPLFKKKFEIDQKVLLVKHLCREGTIIGYTEIFGGPEGKIHSVEYQVAILESIFDYHHEFIVSDFLGKKSTSITVDENDLLPIDSTTYDGITQKILNQSKSCICNITDLMKSGCKCGGS